MKIKCIIQGPIHTNSYIISNHDQCILIDPEGEVDSFLAYFEKKQVTPIAILLTHGHFDHIGAVESLKNLYDLPVYASAKEVELLNEPTLNLSTHVGKKITVPVDHPLQDLDTLTLAGLPIIAWETPGHTAGSMCYLIE
ncbi:MAG: MBL fold metallo-hydrolase, partial [Erysipelotrichaceae bacterium]|nr:MBL fold metallo-hydrolase [Erysipelotrichaceae bacterium]